MIGRGFGSVMNTIFRARTPLNNAGAGEQPSSHLADSPSRVVTPDSIAQKNDRILTKSTGTRDGVVTTEGVVVLRAMA